MRSRLASSKLKSGVLGTAAPTAPDGSFSLSRHEGGRLPRAAPAREACKGWEGGHAGGGRRAASQLLQEVRVACSPISSNTQPVRRRSVPTGVKNLRVPSMSVLCVE